MSFLHRKYPEREGLENDYRCLVSQSDPELQATMPKTMNNLQSVVLFGMPARLAHQTCLGINSPKWITSDWCLIDDNNFLSPFSKPKPMLLRF